MSAATGPARRTTADLVAVIDANARLWAGEAEVFTAYFASPQRDARSDARWLAGQCFKELVDGVAGRLAQLGAAATPEAAAEALRDEVVRVELQHYVAFAAAYRVACRALGEAVPAGRIGADWPENAALQGMRARHRRDHGEIGERAAAFTEGGYCTLYRAGMALEGRSPLDAAIAAACARVYDDEWDHMLAGIAGLAEALLAPADWALLRRLTLEQSRARIRMRNAQFGTPLDEGRVRALESGAAAPLSFDYARAGLRAD